ncbi:MAG: hypothetical protein WDZ91_09510 [Paenibacillaceae bacterium]
MDIIEKIALSLAIIVLGILVGKVLSRLSQGKWSGSVVTVEKWLNGMTMIALLALGPLILIGVFWIVDIRQMNLYYLPIIGILCLVLGGLFAIGFAKVLKLDRKRTGSMFVSGTFYNWGSFGMLFCFMILGQQSLVYVVMVRIFEELIYYTIAFPMAKAYGIKQQEDQGQKLARIRILADPFILTALLAILIGGILNFSPLGRPGLYEMFINIVVPLSILLLIIPIGYRMQFMAVQDYLKESFSISIVRFIMVPICIIPLAYGLGLGNLHDGMVLRTILILSAMPPAFMSLIPPKLYGLDVNLAMSGFKQTMGIIGKIIITSRNHNMIVVY